MTDSIEQIQDAITDVQPELEGRRKKFLRYFLIGTITVVTAVTFGFIQLSDNANIRDSQIPIIIFSFVGSILVFHGLNIYYRVTTKKRFLTAIAEFTGLTWNKNGVFPVRELEEHRVLPIYDRHRVIDGFEGSYKDIPLAFQEIILTDLEPDPNNRDRKREYMNFWGLAVRIKLRRPVGSHTVVIPRNALQTFFRTTFSDFQRIKLVSNKFEKKYNVMGTDQVEGRVILDPAFIERFMETGTVLKSKWMEVSFKGDEVVFIIQRFRHLFEIGQLWTALDEEYLQKSSQDINTVLRIIDVLKLNPQIGV